MDLKLTFNLDAKMYNKHRPVYPEAMYQDLCQMTAGKAALEIGIGTGQATRPLLNRGYEITAVEIGDKLAALCVEKFKDFETFKVINASFEEADLDDSYNLIYSASAFHWIPLDEGLKKVSNLLKPDGVFAWISVQPCPSKNHEHIHHDVQRVYQAYNHHFKFEKPLGGYDDLMDMLDKRKTFRSQALDEHGFSDVAIKSYKGSRILSSQDYVELISTYSDHKSMPESMLKTFLKEIKSAIDSHGGYFELEDNYIMGLGRKV